MTFKKCFKYNHPTKPIWLMCSDGLTFEPLFLGRLRPELLTSNQLDIAALPGLRPELLTSSQLDIAALPGGTSCPYISLGRNGWGSVTEIYFWSL